MDFREEPMRRPASVMSLTIITVASAALTLIWLVKVWLGDNTTDRTILLILAVITVTLAVVTSGIMRKIRNRDITP
jgi:Na+/melibiose symporter-like transporter